MGNYTNLTNESLLNEILDMGYSEIPEGTNELLVNLTNPEFDIVPIFEKFMEYFQEKMTVAPYYRDENKMDYRYNDRIVLRYNKLTKILEINIGHILSTLNEKHGIPSQIGIRLIRDWYSYKYNKEVSDISTYLTYE